jgi:hypothetical protein
MVSRPLPGRLIAGKTWNLAMLRILRQTLVALMLVLYGSVSFCGYGLHALTDSGSSHASSVGFDSKEGRIIRDGAGHADKGHCVICEFHAQGQMTTEPFSIISRPFTSPHIALVLSLVAARDRHPSCSPRAPPIVRASVDATA